MGGKGQGSDCFGKHGKQHACDALERIKGGVDADDLRGRHQFGHAQRDGGTCGMADDGAGVQVFGMAQGGDIFGHVIQPAAALRAQLGEALAG